MPSLRANGIDLEYDTFGDRRHDPLVLVMGLGAQMLLWDEAFCGALAARGHYVVRYDNRDVGKSTWFDQHPVPNPMELMMAAASGKPVPVPYTLDDMADDAAGLADALGFAKADFVGASMGGMIVQTVAYRHPARVRSLVSIMSSTGSPSVPPAKPEAMAVLMRPPATTREAAIDASVHTWRTIGSPGFPFDEAEVRRRNAEMYDRANHPEGAGRQMAAIVAHGDRTAKLGSVRAPTLVIHGIDDPLVPVEGGKATASAIAGAELWLIPGMGHDIPVPLHGEIAERISAHVKKAATARA
jgi:pimeloyl-ACP methyl ester carboxylesterase